MNVQSILSDAGVSFGALTLGVLLRGLAALLLGLLLVKLLLKLAAKLLARSKRLAVISRYLLSAARVLLYVLLALVVLGSLGVEVTSLVALLSVAGLAVSLAMQNALSNVAGGIMIFVSKPFTAGDYISADGTEGTVEAVGLSYCTVKTVDNKEIFIPNAQLSGAKIVNYNRLGRRRVDLSLTASYDAPTAAVKAAVSDAAAQFPQILPDPAPVTCLSEYGPSSISYIARVWVRAEDYWDVYFDTIEQVRAAFIANGIEIPFNQLDVHIVDNKAN